MGYSHYGKVLEKIGRKLEIKIAKLKHFGRLYGHMDGDIKYMDEKDLNHVGNLNGDSRKKHYSLKINFHGIRQLAGHPKLCGMAYWPFRGTIVPSSSCHTPRLEHLPSFINVWNSL
jgi:hypothetical protein